MFLVCSSASQSGDVSFLVSRRQTSGILGRTYTPTESFRCRERVVLGISARSAFHRCGNQLNRLVLLVKGQLQLFGSEDAVATIVENVAV